MTPADALLAEAAELRARAEVAEAEARRLQAQEREDAIVTALSLYDGPLTRRGPALAVDLSRTRQTAGGANVRSTNCLTRSPRSGARGTGLRSRGGEPHRPSPDFNVAKLKSGAVAIATGDMTMLQITDRKWSG